MVASHLDEIRALVADVLGMRESRVTGDTGPGTEEAWDSLAHLTIVTAVEREYGVRFSMDEVRSIESIRHLDTLLSARLGAAGD